MLDERSIFNVDFPEFRIALIVKLRLKYRLVIQAIDKNRIAAIMSVMYNSAVSLQTKMNQ